MRALSRVRTLLAGSPIPGGRWVQIGYVLADLFFITLNAVAVFCFRYVPDWLTSLAHGKFPKIPGDAEHLGFLLLYGVLVVMLCQSQDLYRTLRTRSGLDESLAVAKAVTLATVLLTAFIYLSGVKSVSRLVVGSSGVLNLVTLVSWRLWRREMVKRRVIQGHGARNVLIVGAGKVGQELARYFEENKQLGFVTKGFLDEDHAADPRVLGRIQDLAQVVRAQFIDEIFITIPSQRELVRAVALEARRSRQDVKVVPELFEGLGWRAPLEHLGDFPVMALHREPIPALALFVKRTADITFSALGLILLSPLLVAVAMAIKLDSPGPFFYRAQRVGKKGRKFNCFKFRTMVADADTLKEGLRHLNERQGPFFKIANDPRVTRLGRSLRKYSLDELPQLWNVLKGDMSLVGPRPHPTDDFEQYSLEHLRRLDVAPGITGLWQVSARRDSSFEKGMELDLEYIENWDLWLDVKILLRTIPVVLRGLGQ